MRALGEAIDHRHVGMVGKLDEVLMLENADDDGVDETRQHARRVGDGLAAAELHFLAGEHHRLAAEFSHGEVKRHARARRRLIEDHRQDLPGERQLGGAAAFAPNRLDRRRFV